MKINKVMWLIVAFVVVVTVAVSFGTFDSHSQIQKAQPSPTPFNDSLLKRDFPSVDYTAELSSDPLRLLRGAKYDRYKTLDPDISADEKEVSFVDWVTWTSALPLANSDIIAIGKLVSSDAFLSNNKNSVYTEYKIEVEKEYKNSSKVSSDQNKYLTAEREGGIVVFPNGFKTWYFVSGQRMPTVGERYLFFLSHDFPIYGKQERDLYLLTAYQIKNGKVLPLDYAGGESHPMAFEYRNKEETKILEDLEKELSKSKENPKKRRHL